MSVMQAPAQIRDIVRPPRELSAALARIGTATISSELNRMGVRDPHIRGPVPLVPGRIAAGPALTLMCMPKREDLFNGAEYDNPDLQLHRHVMFPAKAGDMIVVDARGDGEDGEESGGLCEHVVGFVVVSWEKWWVLEGSGVLWWK